MEEAAISFTSAWLQPWLDDDISGSIINDRMSIINGLNENFLFLFCPCIMVTSFLFCFFSYHFYLHNPLFLFLYVHQIIWQCPSHSKYPKYWIIHTDISIWSMWALHDQSMSAYSDSCYCWIALSILNELLLIQNSFYQTSQGPRPHFTNKFYWASILSIFSS